ncbi:MAG TPA: inosine/xanthosine triphosphatase [Patescibacteria group bacterium]
MHIFVGSTNPVKINAVVNATSETWPDVIVEGFEVPSGISEQPMSDEETRQGATNRAKAALEAGLKGHSSTGEALGIGLEGGVFKQGPELWSTVWVVVVDKDGNMSESNGARFKVPDQIAQPILKGGEMGPVVSQLFGRNDIKQKQGAIGVITQGFVDRTEEYTGIAKLALGLWYGRDWYQTIKKT